MRKVYRSAIDGEFVTEEYARAHPETTVCEEVPDVEGLLSSFEILPSTKELIPRPLGGLALWYPLGSR